VLKHQHAWVAKQQISVDVEQRISIIGALEMAQQRVVEGEYVELPSAPVERVRRRRPSQLPAVQHVA
jgi:hypothetical protein